MNSYQIKSTPFFRRMVSSSKKNGQLQRLREEYERLKDINERTIETRMRQVRLKRLYKEIDDIRESSIAIAKRNQYNFVERPKTAEDLRVEAIIRAKEMGKEYSRLNGLMYDRQMAPNPMYSSVRAQYEKKVRENLKVKERIVKSIDYGNKLSRNNIRKMSQSKKKKVSPKSSTTMVMAPEPQMYNDARELDAKTTAPKNSNSLTMEEQRLENRRKLSQLKQRLEYGNNWSSHNMAKIPKRNTGHQLICETPPTMSTAVSATDATTLSMVGKAPPPSVTQQTPIPKQTVPSKTAPSSDGGASNIFSINIQQNFRYLRALEDLQQAQARMVTPGVAASLRPTNTPLDESSQERAQRNWRKVGVAARDPKQLWRIRKLQQQQLHQQQQQRLQHHLQQQLMEQQQQQQLKEQQATMEAAAASTNDNDFYTVPLAEQQKLLQDHLSMKQMLEAASAKLPPESEHELDSEYDMQTADEFDEDFDDLPLPPPPPQNELDAAAVTAPTTHASEYGPNLDMPDLASKVHNFMKPYEAVVRATAAKEAVEFTVQNLCNIFEHKQ